tara:strand:- start:671 stop:916 length:246 start_codon:yes stop_codon:yes gene_type:complete
MGAPETTLKYSSSYDRKMNGYTVFKKAIAASDATRVRVQTFRGDKAEEKATALADSFASMVTDDSVQHVWMSYSKYSGFPK